MELQVIIHFFVSTYKAAKQRLIGAWRGDGSPTQQAQHDNGAGDIEQGEIHATSEAPGSASTTAGADEVQVRKTRRRMSASPPSYTTSPSSYPTSRQRRWSRAQRKAAERFVNKIFTVSAGGLYSILSACISANVGNMHIFLRLCVLLLVLLLVVASLCSAIIVFLVNLCHRYHYFDTIIKVVIIITSASMLLSVILGCLLLLKSKI